MAYESNIALKKEDSDPLIHESGSHPVGTTIGAAVGAAAVLGSSAAIGASTGAVMGPIGAVVGATIGAIAGGYGGKWIAEDVNPTVEDAYWRENYKHRSYVEKNASYDAYKPAYLHGVDAYSKYEGQQFNEIEPQLRTGWEKVRGNSPLEWEKAKFASQDAYTRLLNRTVRPENK